MNNNTTDKAIETKLLKEAETIINNDKPLDDEFFASLNAYPIMVRSHVISGIVELLDKYHNKIMSDVK